MAAYRQVYGFGHLRVTAEERDQLSSGTLHLFQVRDYFYLYLKDHRQRIHRFVIRRYLEKSIQKKLFAIYNHYK